MSIARETISTLSRVRAVARKEVRHILRDRQTLAIVVAMPVLMMFLYGYALTMDVHKIRTAIEDPGGSPAARYLAARLDAGTLFDVDAVLPAVPDIDAVFRNRDIKLLLRIPPSFAEDLRRDGGTAHVQALIDGTDQNVGTIIRTSIEPVLRDIVLDYLHIDPPTPVEITTHVLYNPQQKSSLYFVPGLFAIILTMISALLTSLTITREKERGTMEQLLVSPLRPREIMVGKIIPYVALAALDGVIILVVGEAFFDVRVAGSLLFLAAACLLFIGVSLCLGLIFSTLARTQQQAMLMVLPATVLPTIILSGFIFPIRSMPAALRVVAHAIPATYFLRIIRGIILKGTGPLILREELGILAAFGLVFLLVSIRKFEVRL